MSIKTFLMPYVTERVFSRKSLIKKRQKAELARKKQGRPHEVHYFHQVDDPYSALLAQALPRLLERYNIVLKPHLVAAPDDAAAPERDKLVAYSRYDAALLARHHILQFNDPGRQPSKENTDHALHVLASAVLNQRFVAIAGPISKWLWSSSETAMPDECNALPMVTQAQVKALVDEGTALRQSLGHYLGGMLYYEGEWYWGIDRLYHLEERLQGLAAQKEGVAGNVFPLDADLTQPIQLAYPPAIDFYFSFRSPYSAIVAQRVFDLARLTGAKVNLKFVLPMVMRGLPVPKAKRTYIAHDTAREAHARGIAFGRLNDPVGRPAERGLALVPFAEQHGKGQAFVAAFMKAVWAEGVDAGSDSGLKKIVRRAGLSWTAAQQALNDDAWRKQAEAHRTEMFELGLWGVPCFRVNGTVAWGQDRLWVVRDAIVRSAKARAIGG